MPRSRLVPSGSQDVPANTLVRVLANEIKQNEMKSWEVNRGFLLTGTTHFNTILVWK